MRATDFQEAADKVQAVLSKYFKKHLQK